MSWSLIGLILCVKKKKSLQKKKQKKILEFSQYIQEHFKSKESELQSICTTLPVNTSWKFPDPVKEVEGGAGKPTSNLRICGFFPLTHD